MPKDFRLSILKEDKMHICTIMIFPFDYGAAAREGVRALMDRDARDVFINSVANPG
jgi:hypothetical protein